jgi:hypothetical protein
MVLYLIIMKRRVLHLLIYLLIFFVALVHYVMVSVVYLLLQLLYHHLHIDLNYWVLLHTLIYEALEVSVFLLRMKDYIVCKTCTSCISYYCTFFAVQLITNISCFRSPVRYLMYLKR